jgi:autotransporter translocation and assembly factor TamB
MAEEPQAPDRVEPDGDALSDAPVAPKWRRARRIVVRVLAVLVAVLAGLFVAFFTVDLGPELKGVAEREGSKYLKRTMHIGKLSAKLRPGEFVLDDLVIEGLTPQDRPFLVAKKVTVTVPWWTVFQRWIIIDSITMTDWEMVIETFPASPGFPNGRHNLPRLKPEGDPSKPKGPSRFTTRLQSVLATRGKFTYDDHGTPWGVVAPNITVRMFWGGVTNDYRGGASFSDGTVRIMSYLPFRASMQSQFHMSGGKLHFDRMDLVSEGARSQVTGDIDFSRWPEQLYQVRSHIDFPTQKNIYFHGQNFEVSGVGDFTGTFHLFKGGRELNGSFTSEVAGVNQWRFPKLRGNVLWLPDRLEITNATSGLYGGTAKFDYRMAPLNRRGTRATAFWDVEYNGVSLPQLTDLLALEGLRLAGTATGKNRLQWPLGRWAEKKGGGEVSVTPPAGITAMTRELPVERVNELAALPEEEGPFNPRAPLGYVPVAGHVVYSLDPQVIVLGDSWAATPKTYVEFKGRTAFGERSEIPFHVTSLDWQESDRVLAGIMTAFGARTGAVPIGGYGTFDGVMRASFSKPRIEGSFSGERMRAWDVVWGRGRAKVVIENSYVTVENGVISKDGSEIRADGLFSLGYPRKDGGEEIDARVRISKRPIADLRHAFELDDYNLDGLLSGDYHIFGRYERPNGYGGLEIEQGTAYGESFDRATAGLRFEGNGVRVDTLEIAKSTGSVTGAAWVSWDGTYSFNADGRRIPVESLDTVKFPRAPLSGLLQFSASGAGEFESPRYDVKLRVDDLFAGDEGIGQLTSRLSIRDEVLTIAELEVASPRLAFSGSGRIALTPEMDGELTFRFTDASLDPYVRFFQPRLSPFATAIAGGTIRVLGELANPKQLVVDATVEQLDLKLFDYQVRNEGPIQLALDQNVIDIRRLRLAGEGTQLQVGGRISLDERRISVEALGDANLGILQGFFRDIRSRGTATLTAQITGPLSSPVFAGSATIANGRLRHFALPHSLEDVNGTIAFAQDALRLENVTGRLGGGEVTFGGRIGLNGFAPGDLSLTASGDRMTVRYPEGFRSIIDADLELTGTLNAMLLSGTVDVRDAVWTRRFDASPDFFSLGGGGPSIASVAPQTIPLRFDIQINAPSTLRIENNLAQGIVARADLRLGGTYDRPTLFGRAEVERGAIVFEGNRYIVTQGSVDFLNPSRIEPFFDIEAETRIRVPGQTYNVTIALSGTPSRMAPPSLNSDPPLPVVDIISLLFGDTNVGNDAELRALRPEEAQQSEEALLRLGLGRALASPATAPFTRAFERGTGATLLITPTVGSETDPLTPSARLVIGRRISNSVYLTFARSLGNTQRDQILILEYDQNERLGWVLSQNGDGTFAVDFRVRHRF